MTYTPRNKSLPTNPDELNEWLLKPAGYQGQKTWSWPWKRDMDAIEHVYSWANRDGYVIVLTDGRQFVVTGLMQAVLRSQLSDDVRSIASPDSLEQYKSIDSPALPQITRIEPDETHRGFVARTDDDQEIPLSPYDVKTIISA